MKFFNDEKKVKMVTLSGGYISIMCSGYELGMYKLIDHKVIAYRNNNSNNQDFREFASIKEAEKWITSTLLDQGVVA